MVLQKSYSTDKKGGGGRSMSVLIKIHNYIYFLVYRKAIFPPEGFTR